ncbi:MAG: SiaC family regulatory phosphoprotein [Alphaproteobacteria bacterium]|nr:SiaC family regulatory phosphoprotein [Alphaproteobacteria bacterium]
MVERITIEGTRSSPAVDCDPNKRVIHLSGESYPENTFDFYRPIIAWLDAVLDDGSNQAVTLEIALSYLNTGSIKSMMDMLDRMDEAHDTGIEVSVIWRCDPENERIVELAEELLEDVSLPYDIVTD